jgi:hypothetical protein
VPYRYASLDVRVHGHPGVPTSMATAMGAPWHSSSTAATRGTSGPADAPRRPSGCSTSSSFCCSAARAWLHCTSRSAGGTDGRKRSSGVASASSMASSRPTRPQRGLSCHHGVGGVGNRSGPTGSGTPTSPHGLGLRTAPPRARVTCAAHPSQGWSPRCFHHSPLTHAGFTWTGLFPGTPRRRSI